MCHYCGCRHIPLIRDYIDEHERVLDLGHRALEEIGHGALVSDSQGEEEVEFALMRGDELYREHIDPLIAEHRELDEVLRTFDVHDAEHRAMLKEQVAELRIHISKEEDGIFPVTLVEFSGPEWDAAIDAWHRAHPGQQLMAD